MIERTINEAFFKSETWKKLEKRLRYICSKFGRKEYADDVVNSYALYLLEGNGQHQTIDQYFIDYSRANQWCYRNNDVRADEKAIFKNTLSLDYTTDDNNSFHEIIGQSDFKDTTINELAKSLRGGNRIIFLLIAKWGLNEVEIGDIFSVSSSRISQRITGIQGRLSERIKEEKRNAERERGLQEIQETETFGKSELGKRESQEMEAEEPREASDYYEACQQKWLI